MELIEVPAALAASHAMYFGAEGRAWIASLPSLVSEMLSRWDLVVDGPAGCGAVALVLPVVRRDGTTAALKVQPVDDETRGEAEALRLWAAHGAVRVLEADTGSGSMLLERLDASRPLSSVADDETALRVITGLLRRLNSVAAPPTMRSLGEVGRATLDGVPQAMRLVTDPDETGLLQDWSARLSELLQDPVGDRLLHWDLHYDNVLAGPDADRPWVVIDPKPLAGDPGFELLPALWNRWDDVVASGDVDRAVRRRFDLMTEALGLDRQRAASWTATRVLQDAVWDLTKFGATAVRPIHRRIAEVVTAQ